MCQGWPDLPPARATYDTNKIGKSRNSESHFSCIQIQSANLFLKINITKAGIDKLYVQNKDKDHFEEITIFKA